MRIIAGLVRRSKQALARVPEGALVASTVVLASLGSFGLGHLSGRAVGEKGEIQILERQVVEATLGTVSSAEVPSAVPVASGGQYVASKTGKSYHLPWCSGAKLIKEENKIWFATKEAAEAKGYTPAGNCPGI